MSTTSLERTGSSTALEAEMGFRTEESASEPPSQVNGVAHEPRPVVPLPASPPDRRPVLAVFCHEPPDTFVGTHAAQVTTALARRGHVNVHLFSRQPFDLDPAVHVHAVGECDTAEPLACVDEFGRRAVNAFLQEFPGGANGVTVMGCEWSSAAALSLLNGIKKVTTLLSLHSLERQRSDMTSEFSQRVEEIELAALRENRTVLIHDPGTAEVAKFWAPESAPRLTVARQRFPVEHFEGVADPGAIKARYQIGPVDPTILFVGDLDDRYGPDVLVKSLPALLRNNKQVRLILVGDGAAYWPLRVFARYLLLEHAVRLAGSVTGQAMHELMQAADIVALPSRESTPWWPVLAGWAARRPVVATHQAAPALLAHEQDSVLVYPHESSMVWGIERVLNDAAFGRRISDAGREKLDERFGWGGLAAQVEELMGVQVR